MIHKFKYKNKNFVLDVDSGCIHLVDDLVFDVLDVYSPLSSIDDSRYNSLKVKYSPDHVSDVITELNDLVSKKLLFSELNLYNINTVNSPIKSMCINIAHDCQLKCKYCFASHGNFGGNSKLMDFNTSKNAIDFLIINSGNRINLEVDFFGGEPLMNFDVVKKNCLLCAKM